MKHNSHGKYPKGFKGGPGNEIPFPSLFSEGDCLYKNPASGNVNRTSGAFTNVGSNGYYWSSTTNSATNGRNLNFNATAMNRSNTNNRANAFPVRSVQEFISTPHGSTPFSITREQLLYDVYRAYLDARRHKRGKSYQLRFEMNLERELVKLRDEIWSGKYKPSKCMCFIIFAPKQREVFAAHFRDRIVHHLFFNYTYGLYERLFIEDSYSCRIGKGTHYGMARMDHHIKSVSENYSKPCYVMKMDIEGYFMHIDRHRLLRFVQDDLLRMKNHVSDNSGKRWREILDYSLLFFLAERIILSNPLENCYIKGSLDDWDGLPESKSLFHTPQGCGLPIGNLTSQLFSNVYLNRLDQYMKRELGCKHYGRYVDDFYVVSGNKAFLHSLVEPVDTFLWEELGVRLHPRKTEVYPAKQGVPFLGAFIRPYRWYVDNYCWKRMRPKLYALETFTNNDGLQSTVNSYLGILQHFSSYYIRRKAFCEIRIVWEKGFFCEFYSRFRLKRDTAYSN